jgi:hypothetical protein
MAVIQKLNYSIQRLTNDRQRFAQSYKPRSYYMLSMFFINYCKESTANQEAFKKC